MTPPVDEQSVRSQDSFVPGQIRLSIRGVLLSMLGWASAVVAYAHLTGFSAEFVFLGLFSGFVILLEVTTADWLAPKWRRLARVVLVLGYVVCGVLLLGKLPSAVTPVTGELLVSYIDIGGPAERLFAFIGQ